MHAKSIKVFSSASIDSCADTLLENRKEEKKREKKGVRSIVKGNIKKDLVCLKIMKHLFAEAKKPKYSNIP